MEDLAKVEGPHHHHHHNQHLHGHHPHHHDLLCRNLWEIWRRLEGIDLEDSAMGKARLIVTAINIMIIILILTIIIVIITAIKIMVIIQVINIILIVRIKITNTIVKTS